MPPKLITSFLKNRFQRVALNGQTGDWRLLAQASVPQRSISGALLFLIFINDDDRSLSFISKLFANDTSFAYDIISSWG